MRLERAAARRRRRIAQLEARLERESARVERLSGQIAELKRRLGEARADTRAARTGLRQENAQLRAERRALKAELAKVPRYELGSYTPGVPGWSERWRRSPGRRVLLYAYKDYSGSLMKWAHALNRHSDQAARCVVFGTHQYGYDVDLVFPLPGIADSDVDVLLGEADVLHVKDETGFYLGTNRLPADFLTRHGKPTVFTHYGGYARKHRDDPAYQAFCARFDARVAMTPDLNYEWFDAAFIPHSVDAAGFAYSWLDGRRVAHSPSTTARKGTEEFLAAIAPLDLELDLIQGVAHVECLRRKEHCSLFFDQAGREIADKLGVDHVIGWYGNSALEAAVHGIPTIAHLSDDGFEGAARAGKEIRDRCPILNTPMDADGMREVVERYFAMTPDERRDLSLRTRAWVEEFHSFERNAAELRELYTRLLA